MKSLPHHLATLLRWISEGRGPVAQVRLASTSWWMGDVSVTRDMNRLRKLGLIRMWRDAARNQHIAISEAGEIFLREQRTTDAA